MPWTAADADRHSAGLSDKQKSQWAAVANSVRDRCLKNGGDAKECDASAIRQANGTVSKMTDGLIAKIDEDQCRVFGWSSVSISDGQQIEDLQGDMIDPEDFEEAMYDFNTHCRLAGEMHEGEATGQMIEGMVFTPEKTLAMFKHLLGEDLAGVVADRIGVRAFHGFEFTPAAFAKVKSGDYRMFSIQGTAERVEREAV